MIELFGKGIRKIVFKVEIVGWTFSETMYTTLIQKYNLHYVLLWKLALSNIPFSYNLFWLSSNMVVSIRGFSSI
jgi:hypothetical protein